MTVFTQLVQRVATAQLERRDAKEKVAHNLLGFPPSSCILINSSLGFLFLLHASVDIK